MSRLDAFGILGKVGFRAMDSGIERLNLSIARSLLLQPISGNNGKKPVPRTQRARARGGERIGGDGFLSPLHDQLLPESEYPVIHSPIKIKCSGLW